MKVYTGEVNEVFQGLAQYLSKRDCEVELTPEDERYFESVFVELKNKQVFVVIVNDPCVVRVRLGVNDESVSGNNLSLDLNSPNVDLVKLCEDWLFQGVRP